MYPHGRASRLRYRDAMNGLRWSALDKEIVRLAVPAFGALIAEPLYVLADTAVVGNIGTSELGGLALASQALLTLHAVMIFLAYGTTAAVSRLLGAGDEREAAHQAVQGLWLAFAAGIVLAAVLWFMTDPALRLLGAEGEILTNGRIYLRISLFGLPAMLLALAGVGYLRGLQDTTRPLVVAVVTAVGNVVLESVLIFGLDFGIGASALSTVVAQWVGAAMYLLWIRRAVRSHAVRLSPDQATIRKLMKVAGDLFVRTAALRASFTIAAAAAARIGEADLGAHEITFQMWYLVALALDAIAIAGQAIVGRYLGAGDGDQAWRLGIRMIQWGLAAGTLACGLILLTRPFVPAIFSDDPAVVSLAGFLFLHLAFMQPINGVAFTLDGILIGAADMRFLAWAMVGAAAVFIPLAVMVPVLDLGIGWVWGSLWVLMVVRASTLTLRFRSRAWIRTGAS